MAVELHCPECRANLRLAEYPEVGTEIECPKCSNVFVAPDPDTGEVPDPRQSSTKKKKKSSGEEKFAKKKPSSEGDKAPAAKSDDKPAEKPKVDEKKIPKKRRAKKNKTNKTGLIAVVVGAILILALLISLLVWFFTRKPASYEMMAYLPADADTANGFNVGHVQKYPEFFKSVEAGYTNLGFKKAADSVGKAAGVENVNEILDYVVSGSGKSGSALVFRTKKPYDPAILAKLPGAQERKSSDGAKYYVADHYSQPRARVRVFSPTNRLIVFCDDTMPDDVFRRMMNGNKDSDKTIIVRMGPLAKRITRGTFWSVILFDTPENKPVAPKESKDGQVQGGSLYKKQLAESTSSAKAMGFKASVGSREVRVEFAILLRDNEAAKSQYDKFKESDLAKGDEVEPPKWWKDMTGEFGDRKIAQDLLANLGATSSGEMFVIYSAVDTKYLINGINSIIGKYTGQQQGFNGPGLGGPGGAGGGPAGPAPGGLGPAPGGIGPGGPGGVGPGGPGRP